MPDTETAPAMMDRETLTNFRRAFEDNERVWYHPDKGLLAIWYGGATVNIYEADTFQEVDMFTQSVAFRDDVELSTVENAIENRLAQRGFYREGRGSGVQTPRTEITER